MAQVVTLNQRVVGSSPTAPTSFKGFPVPSNQMNPSQLTGG